MKYCSFCGCYIPDNWDNCPACGMENYTPELIYYNKEDTFEALQKAEENILKKGEYVHPNVIKHWESILKIELKKEEAEKHLTDESKKYIM